MTGNEINDKVCMILTTCGSEKNARTLAEVLLGRQLAACVSMLPPLTSIYEWQGEIQLDSEIQLIIKSTMGAIEEIENVFKTHHDYELPEFLIIKNEEYGEMSSKFLQWVRTQVKSGAV